MRALPFWLLASGVLASLSAWGFNGWAWRVTVQLDAELPRQFFTLLGWFCWPAWPLAMWTLWRWRAHWKRRHILLPLIAAAVPLATSLLMDGSDRALLLGLPALAVLASFALPTLKRGFSAAMDWFSVFFFSACALFFWVYYVSMHLGWPAQPLANLRRLAEGFTPQFNGLALALALSATLAWLGLVRWRTSRHQHALWKSLVLPAGGVALCWLLTMTLLLPPLDYARSNKALIERLRAQLPPTVGCLAAPDMALSTLAALEFQGHWSVDGNTPLATSRCHYALQGAFTTVPAGWVQIGSVQRPTDRELSFVVLRRPE